MPQAEAEAFWAKGWPEKALNKLQDYGFIQSRPKGEYHANNQARPSVSRKKNNELGHSMPGSRCCSSCTKVMQLS